MCTLSLIRKGDGIRLFMNRDERHDRAPELSPRLLSPQNHVVGPLDPVSGGTWIAFNEHGYWGCLLNGYFESDQSQSNAMGCVSRGEILPKLLTQVDPLVAVESLDASRYLSFRLLVGIQDRFRLLQWDGKTFGDTQFHLNYEDQAYLLSSSSWQQDKVIELRKIQFRRWLQHASYTSNGIPSFHFSKQPNPLSAPMMLRSYSGTKSITSMDVTGKKVIMGYQTVDQQTAAINDDKRALA